MNSLTDKYKIYNGVEIPCIGFGTWLTPDGDTAKNSVMEAIRVGYRLIDTAAYYYNEESVGRAIKESGVNRSELFVTSKLWNTERGYDKTMRAFDVTMNKLGLDYLDLYLIHWPAAKHQFDNWEELNLSTWKAFTELYKQGRIKAIGVSNFKPHHLRALMETEITPMVEQLEFHPGFMQQEIVTYCREHNMLIEAWSPLGNGKMLTNETLIDIAAKYNISVAQLCLRWCMQNGTIPLTKSVTPSRILENSHVFDFSISDEDVATINSMEYFAGSGFDADNLNR